MKSTVVFGLGLMLGLTACVSTQSTLKNVEPYAPAPVLRNASQFRVTDKAVDGRYGYDPDYPVNVYYQSAKNDSLNAWRYLRALAGPQGQPLHIKKLGSCCPFPTKNHKMGAGLLDQYELRWEGCPNPLLLYVNPYEKGYLFIPQGLTAQP